MEPYNRTAKRRAEEAKMDEKSKKKNVRPKARTDSMKAVRPKARPVDVSPRAERNEAETAQRFEKGGEVEAPGMKSCQMSGRGGGKIF